MVNIWEKCHGVRYINELVETVWRLVEAGEFTATRKLVDSYAEQLILEEMIESQKPILLHAYSHYHPLYFTPFRYPPLLYGSRFGTNREASLWYGSLKLETAMAEKSFYQFNFLRASNVHFGIVSVPLTAFTAQVKTARGIQLNVKPFSDYHADISNPRSYEMSQLLGKSMRDDVRAFSYLSARDSLFGINVALYTPKSFQSKMPEENSFQSWRLIANTTVMEFSRESAMFAETKSFSIEQFKINGDLPFPAAT